MSEKDTPPMTATSPTEAPNPVIKALAEFMPCGERDCGGWVCRYHGSDSDVQAMRDGLANAIKDLLHLTESVARAFDVQSNIVEQHLLVEEAKKLAKKYAEDKEE